MENDFQPVVGHKFTFRSTPVPNWDGIIDCEVLVVEPNKKLSYSWGTLGLESVVVWTLARPKAARSCAWSSPASVPIKRPPIRARTTAGRSSSAAWNGLSPGCTARAGLAKTKDRREHEADKSSEWRGRFSEHHQAD